MNLVALPASSSTPTAAHLRAADMSWRHSPRVVRHNNSMRRTVLPAAADAER